MTDAIFRTLMYREAIASVSLSHEASCRCLICRAALGDYDAIEQMMVLINEEEERRREGGST